VRISTPSLWLAFLMLLAVAAPDVAAQGNPRITIFGGGSFLQGDRSFVVSGDNFTTEFITGGKLRARASLDLTSHWTLEADYTFGRNNFRVNEMGTTPAQRDFGIRVNNVTLNLVRFFTASKRRFRPYLGTGIGWVRYSPTDAAKNLALTGEFIGAPANLTATNDFSIPFGGGIEFRFSRWLGTRIDVRDNISRVARFGVPTTPGGPGGAFFPVDGITHNVQVEIGVVFFLKPKD